MKILKIQIRKMIPTSHGVAIRTTIDPRKLQPTTNTTTIGRGDYK